MPSTKTAEEGTPIRGVGWKKKSTISLEKVDRVASAIPASLTATPIRFTEFAERFASKLPDFEGSVAWYTITSVRELEIRGQITRQAKADLYAKGDRCFRSGYGRP